MSNPDLVLNLAISGLVLNAVGFLFAGVAYIPFIVAIASLAKPMLKVAHATERSASKVRKSLMKPLAGPALVSVSSDGPFLEFFKPRGTAYMAATGFATAVMLASVALVIAASVEYSRGPATIAPLPAMHVLIAMWSVFGAHVAVFASHAMRFSIALSMPWVREVQTVVPNPEYNG